MCEFIFWTLFKLTAVIPYLKLCKLVWYWALCFVPHIAMSSTAGPEEDLRTAVVYDLHIQNTWARSVGEDGPGAGTQRDNTVFLLFSATSEQLCIKSRIRLQYRRLTLTGCSSASSLPVFGPYSL